MLIQQHHMPCPTQTAPKNRGQDAIRPDDDLEDTTDRRAPLTNRHRDFPVPTPLFIHREGSCPGMPLLHDRRPPRLSAVKTSGGIIHPSTDQLAVRPYNGEGMEISMLLFTPSLHLGIRLRREHRSLHGRSGIGKRGKPLHPLNFTGKQ